MSEKTPITLVPVIDFEQRLDSGLMVPMHSGEGIRTIDCADDRELTEASVLLRKILLQRANMPGRFFGGASGFAVASLMTFSAQHGERAMRDFVDNFSAEAFTDFAADISDRAHRQFDMDLHQHSAHSNENDTVGLADPAKVDSPLGCAFATLAGRVLDSAAHNPMTISESRQIVSMAGTDLPLAEAQEGGKVLGLFLPKTLGIHRGALDHAVKSDKYVPIAIHAGSHTPNDKTSLVIDLAGYRSSAKAHVRSGIPRYHHTPSLVSELLPELLPEFNLDPRLLEASALLLGLSTRGALSGEENPHALGVEVIPAEYAHVA